MFTHQVQEIKSIEDICSKGRLIGRGAYGKAYQIGKVVYKIYHFDEEDTLCNPAERSARYWNKTYQQIYQGKYKDQATARHEILPSKDGKDYSVLITPFIQGEIPGSGDVKFKEIFKFNEEFNKPPVHLCMWDDNSLGNIRKTLSGDWLPIDFDLVVPSPDKTSESINFYNTPQSPMSKFLIRKHFSWQKKAVFLDEEQVTSPKPLPQVAELKESQDTFSPPTNSCTKSSKLCKFGIFAATIIVTAYVCQQEIVGSSIKKFF